MDDLETNRLLTTVNVACSIVDKMPSSAKEYFIRKVVTNKSEIPNHINGKAFFSPGALGRAQDVALKIARELKTELEEENGMTKEQVQEGVEPGE